MYTFVKSVYTWRLALGAAAGSAAVKHQTPLMTDEHDAGRRVDEAAAAAAPAAGGCGVSQLHRLTVVNVTVHCEHSPTRRVHTRARYHDNRHHHHHRTSEASVYLARAVITRQLKIHSVHLINTDDTHPRSMPAELRCESATVYTHRRHYLLLLLIPNADTHFTVPIVEICKCGFLVSLSTMVRS